jgi:hypothetical protein
LIKQNEESTLLPFTAASFFRGLALQKPIQPQRKRKDSSMTSGGSCKIIMMKMMRKKDKPKESALQSSRLSK